MQKANPIKLKPTPKPFNGNIERKPSVTEQISSKMTSPTLVEFRSQNSQLPEWRLQLQNAVQQRLKTEQAEPKRERPVPVENRTPEAAPAAPPSPSEVEASSVKTSIDNKYLSNALRRIERSRTRYLAPAREARKPKPPVPATKKEYPFTIASRTENPIQEKDRPEAKPEPKIKPKLVAGKKKAKLIKDLYDTSELNPNFPPARMSSSFTARTEKQPRVEIPAPATKQEAEVRVEPAVEARKPVEEMERKPTVAKAETALPTVEEQKTEDVSAEFTSDEIDDYAPFSLRFNAGCFDFLIGSFLSFVLLVPFIAAGGEWFTFSGALAFAATCSIVMFIYLTTSVGFAGKSFGMHLFSLEVIDIGGENYPTLHQSAVSSVVYLISTAFLGIGFVTSLFDEDRRAAHDLLSGTLVVREL